MQAVMMRTMLRKICRLTLAVTLAAGMTVGLGACNNRQEAPTNIGPICPALSKTIPIKPGMHGCKAASALAQFLRRFAMKCAA